MNKTIFIDGQQFDYDENGNYELEIYPMAFNPKLDAFCMTKCDDAESFTVELRRYDDEDRDYDIELDFEVKTMHDAESFANRLAAAMGAKEDEPEPFGTSYIEGDDW